MLLTSSPNGNKPETTKLTIQLHTTILSDNDNGNDHSKSPTATEGEEEKSEALSYNNYFNVDPTYV